MSLVGRIKAIISWRGRRAFQQTVREVAAGRDFSTFETFDGPPNHRLTGHDVFETDWRGD
jgi:hypothetical protein